MEINVHDELQNALKTNEQRQQEISRLISRTALQLCHHQKPHHDLLQLTKMSMDITRLRIHLLKELSTLPPQEVPRTKATREDWEIVKNAVLRGKEPVWD